MWTGILSPGMNGDRRVLGNKAGVAREKREGDSPTFNASFTTNSSIEMIKFHFFQGFWEKERFILIEILLGMLN